MRLRKLKLYIFKTSLYHRYLSSRVRIAFYYILFSIVYNYNYTAKTLSKNDWSGMKPLALKTQEAGLN